MYASPDLAGFGPVALLFPLYALLTLNGYQTIQWTDLADYRICSFRLISNDILNPGGQRVARESPFPTLSQPSRYSAHRLPAACRLYPPAVDEVRVSWPLLKSPSIPSRISLTRGDGGGIEVRRVPSALF